MTGTKMVQLDESICPIKNLDKVNERQQKSLII